VSHRNRSVTAPAGRLVLALALLAALPAAAQDGEKVFRRCAACHGLEAGENRPTGPSLAGVIGRPAGSLEAFAYSSAMREAGEDGLVWDDETLGQYIENPKELVPGTKMAFTGIKSEDERRALIEYITANGGEE
jgi:cytochrome c2